MPVAGRRRRRPVCAVSSIARRRPSKLAASRFLPSSRATCAGSARPIPGDREARRVRVAEDRERLEGRAEIGRAEVRDRVDADIGRDPTARVGPLPVRDAHQVGVLGLELEHLLGVPREHLLVALLVAEPRVRQRAEDRELVGHPGMHRQELADPDALGLRGDRAERAADLGRGVGLGVVGLQVARPALEPDDEQGGPVAGRGRPRPRPSARAGPTREAGQAGPQEFAASHEGRPITPKAAGPTAKTRDRINPGPEC